MSETALPAHIGWGYVRGRVIQSVADTAEDTDEFPQARPLAGTVLFTSDVPVSFGSPDQAGDAGYADLVFHDPITANLSSSGRLMDAEGRQGLWLPEGSWEVEVRPTGGGRSMKGRFTVDPELHTTQSPLQLAAAFPFVPPTTSTVRTLVVPDGGTGKVLSRDVAGQLLWIDQATGGGATYDDAPLTQRVAAEEQARADGDSALDGRVTDLEEAPAPDLSGYVQTTDPRLSDDRDPTAHQHPAGDVTGLATVATSGAYGDLTGVPTIPSTPGEVGAQPAGSYATLVGGVIPTSQIPALAITTPHVVADEAAMLALVDVQQGDVAIRPGQGSWILGDGAPSVLASWTQLSTPDTAPVQSVNGQTGAIVLSASDVDALPNTYVPAWGDLSGFPAVIAAGPTAAEARQTVGLGDVDNTRDVDKPVSTATAQALGTKADATHDHEGVYQPAGSYSEDGHQHSAADVTSGQFTVALMPPGTVLRVLHTGAAWPDRPTARTDIGVHWVGSTQADPPPGAIPGDLHDYQDA